MKTKRQFPNQGLVAALSCRCRRFMSALALITGGGMLSALTLVGGAGLLSSCEQYDLDERTPDGWGASIYSWLDEQGNFTNTVRMIDDLGSTVDTAGSAAPFALW